MVVASDEVALSTVAMCLLFGTNFLLYLLFTIIGMKQMKQSKSDGTLKKKELSKPFNGTIECFTNLTGDLTRTGLIMAITYICEKHWMFDHATKYYSRDLFMFVLILFFSYAFYTIKPCHDLTLLGREQTEEWKGWMQFIFLLYHYFHAEEVYNSVRVMITCYVWMTGYGNFSFFYIKQDFSWLRFVQMMWRLNFSVLLLMWTHGNTYILYYICPMHTFYFVMVYLTMAIIPSINHSKWLIRVKLMVVGLFIYIIWDINHGLFDSLFGFLGTKPVIGANNGSVWEWYFRTSLDHWSAFLGMIFALNFPLSEQFFSKAKGWPLVATAIGMAGVSIWWFYEFYMKTKLEYNLTHSYSAIIPLTSYIFFRNITPGIRSGVSASLHELGKTTLETYLLQHHVWLTSNAKTLLNITPGYPWINFALATVLFYVLSKELYRLTMNLRGMIMPDEKNLALRNMIGTTLILALVFAVAWVLHSHHTGPLGVILTCFLLFILSILIISRVASTTKDNASFQSWAPKFLVAAALIVVIGGIVNISLISTVNVHTGGGSEGTLATATTTASSKSMKISPGCLSSLSSGHWEQSPCTPIKGSQSAAYCGTQKWVWNQADPFSCPLTGFSSSKLQSIFKGRNIVFMGDSIVRYTYHAFNELIDPDHYVKETNTTVKHMDMNYRVKASNTSVTFVWSALTKDVISHLDTSTPTTSNSTTATETSTSTTSGISSSTDYLILGASLWDALHERDLNQYAKNLDTLSTLIPISSKTKTAWLQPTTLIDSRLNTADKKTHMTEMIIDKYRQTVLESSLPKRINVLIDTRNVSLSREESTVDGIHYSEDIYAVIAQMIANGYALHYPSLYGKTAAKKPVGAKVTGSMSFPTYGAILLALSFVMLFAMDAFLGVGFISLTLFGRSADWDAAYGPLHKKIGIVSETSEASNSLLGGEEKNIELSQLEEK